MDVLGKLRRRKLRKLLRLLLARDAGSRKQAVEGLAKLKDPCAIEPLVLAIKDEECFPIAIRMIEVLEKQIQSISQYDESVIGALSTALNLTSSKRLKGSAFVFVNRAAAEALGRSAHRSAIEPLLAALSSGTQYDICQSAADALSLIGGPHVTDRLIELLGHPAPEVRHAITSVRIALRKVNWEARDAKDRANWFAATHNWEEAIRLGSDSVDALVRELSNPGAYVKRYAAHALDEIGWKPTSTDERVLYEVAKGLGSKNKFDVVVASYTRLDCRGLALVKKYLGRDPIIWDSYKGYKTTFYDEWVGRDCDVHTAQKIQWEFATCGIQVTIHCRRCGLSSYDLPRVACSDWVPFIVRIKEDASPLRRGLDLSSYLICRRCQNADLLFIKFALGYYCFGCGNRDFELVTF